MIYRHPIHLQFKSALEKKGYHTSDYHAVPELQYNGPVHVCDKRRVEYACGILASAGVPYYVDSRNAASSVSHIICKDPDVEVMLQASQARESLMQERADKRNVEYAERTRQAAAASAHADNSDFEEAAYVPSRRR